VQQLVLRYHIHFDCHRHDIRRLECNNWFSNTTYTLIAIGRILEKLECSGWCSNTTNTSVATGVILGRLECSGWFSLFIDWTVGGWSSLVSQQEARDLCTPKLEQSEGPTTFWWVPLNGPVSSGGGE
jgi:hypothetical protein